LRGVVGKVEHQSGSHFGSFVKPDTMKHFDASASVQYITDQTALVNDDKPMPFKRKIRWNNH
jgi:hypothetical protein